MEMLHFPLERRRHQQAGKSCLKMSEISLKAFPYVRRHTPDEVSPVPCWAGYHFFMQDPHEYLFPIQAPAPSYLNRYWSARQGFAGKKNNIMGFNRSK